MSDELSDRMSTGAGSSAAPPLEGLWRAGRRRRRNRRLAGGGGAVLALVLVAGAVASGAGQDDDRLRTGNGPVVSTTLPAAPCDPEPDREAQPTPSTAAELIGGTGRASPAGPRSAPAVVARATVLRSWWLEPETVGPGERSWQHRLEIEVTDPIKGAAAGDRLTVYDAMGMAGPADASSDEPRGISGPPCHQFEVGDDVILALAAPDGGAGDDVYEGPGSSYFLITDGRFSPELDADRRWLGAKYYREWGDSELLQQARDLSPDQFLDVLRGAVMATEAEPGDDATWTVSPDGQPSGTGSTFTALVTRTGCAGGQTGTVLRPGIRLLDYAVEIRFTVEALPPGTVATCQGNTAVPVEVDIGEPLGTRELIDAACVRETQAAGTAACLPNGKRWPN